MRLSRSLLLGSMRYMAMRNTSGMPRRLMSSPNVSLFQTAAMARVGDIDIAHFRLDRDVGFVDINDLNLGIGNRVFLQKRRNFCP